MVDPQASAAVSAEGLSTREERVAAALICSYGPTTENENISNMDNSAFAVSVNKLSLRDESGHTAGMSQLEDARSKFLGGFTSLKSEISQLKQTIMDH